VSLRGPIVVQPNGRFAVWSSVADGFAILDATADELVCHLEIEAARQARIETLSAIRKAKAKGPRVFQALVLDERELRPHRFGPDGERLETDEARDARRAELDELEAAGPRLPGSLEEVVTCSR